VCVSSSSRDHWVRLSQLLLPRNPLQTHRNAPPRLLLLAVLCPSTASFVCVLCLLRLRLITSLPFCASCLACSSLLLAPPASSPPPRRCAAVNTSQISSPPNNIPCCNTAGMVAATTPTRPGLLPAAAVCLRAGSSSRRRRGTPTSTTRTPGCVSCSSVHLNPNGAHLSHRMLPSQSRLCRGGPSLTL
jgi:hypothetical protein